MGEGHRSVGLLSWGFSRWERLYDGTRRTRHRSLGRPVRRVVVTDALEAMSDPMTLEAPMAIDHLLSKEQRAVQRSVRSHRCTPACVCGATWRQYEGTREIHTLNIGRALTGIAAFN
jgi:hypothetical protein